MPAPMLHEACVPVCLHYLGRLRALVDAAERADAARLAGDTLLEARIAPDMFPFAMQVRIAAGFALRAACPLAGVALPADAGEPPTAAGLRARIDRTVAQLAALPPEAFAAAEGRRLQSQAGDARVDLPAREFLWHYALPNFFFHVSAAYTILRAHGVPVGKADFDGFHAYPVPGGAGR